MHNLQMIESILVNFFENFEAAQQHTKRTKNNIHIRTAIKISVEKIYGNHTFLKMRRLQNYLQYLNMKYFSNSYVPLVVEAACYREVFHEREPQTSPYRT